MDTSCLAVRIGNIHVVTFKLYLQVTECYFADKFMATNVYLLEKLQSGHKVAGPAIIIDNNR